MGADPRRYLGLRRVAVQAPPGSPDRPEGGIAEKTEEDLRRRKTRVRRPEHEIKYLFKERNGGEKVLCQNPESADDIVDINNEERGEEFRGNRTSERSSRKKDVGLTTPRR